MRLINEDDVLQIVERVTNEAVEKNQRKYLIQPRIIAEIAGLPTIEVETVNGWISVTDEMPKLGQRVMAFCIAGILTFLRYDGEVWFEMSSRNEYLLSFVTHWQPLPEPPKGE